MSGNFKEGDVVDYHSIIGGEVTSSGHTIKAFGVIGGTPCAWITGKPGGVALEALTHSK